MDEASLEAAIEVYKAQLQQVELALGAGAEAEAEADLLQLQADLQQLIALTESSLLSVRKSQLLEQLHREASSPRPEDGPGAQLLDAEYAAFQAALGEGEAAEQSREPEEAEEISGTKVRAPYRPVWGPLQYHNAMVVGVESEQPPEPRVRVLWIHPTQRAMKPCPFYLSGSCRFLDSCRYSHGEVVAVSELREFEELDLSSLEVGSPCLAKYEDEIWYPAKILDIDNGYFTVKFDSLLQKEIVVEGDGIMPVPRADESSSSSSSEDEGQLGYANVFDENSVDVGNWTPACSSSFAGWEAHTRGIGSKLMAKLGYEFGKGLGKNADGRVEPVQAVVLPPGKSLDQCAEILQNKRDGKLSHLHKKKHKRKFEGGSRVVKERKPRQTVFDFLNDKLGSTGQTSSSLVQTGFPVGEKNSKERYRGSKSMKKALNTQLFQIAEKIEHTEKDIAKIREALARNIGRDKAVTSHLEEKLSNAKKQLSYLKSQESGAQQEQKKADTHKRMTKF
ncbi:zinc finger CCCH-type with G patch domain-containing protein isoform X1 [Carcharodon carcharias]|uniref:zinc finger CCCH-type with G patch domain-containing protein isoform X1 n=1 Tax=Carcharodon carcharias TaxID=13397 RepID=UPI001B7F26F3|nr:zinc finger CCCH-type with G patch domain-containing protein isoform X1 [Carcharodon carcharias]